MHPHFSRTRGGRWRHDDHLGKEHAAAECHDDAIAAPCLKREEHAEDLTGTVFFLASPDADFITGQTIIVDGGNEML